MFILFLLITRCGKVWLRKARNELIEWLCGLTVVWILKVCHLWLNVFCVLCKHLSNSQTVKLEPRAAPSPCFNSQFYEGLSRNSGPRHSVELRICEKPRSEPEKPPPSLRQSVLLLRTQSGSDKARADIPLILLKSPEMENNYWRQIKFLWERRDVVWDSLNILLTRFDWIRSLYLLWWTRTLEEIKWKGKKYFSPGGKCKNGQYPRDN